MLFRRTPTLVGWWQASVFRVHNYATRKTSVLDASAMKTVAALGDWRSVRDLEQGSGLSRRSLRATLSRLVEQSVVEGSDREVNQTQSALSTWSDWSPAAAFMHFSTKDGRYASRRETRARLALLELGADLPSPRKTMKGERTELPSFERRGTFPGVLLARRTWRRFGTAGLTRAQLSTLLGLTWATQRWVHIGATTFALKTSPSGGATHSLEAYVAVRRVKGIEPGLYHYDSDRHELVRLKTRVSRAWIRRCLGGQEWYDAADAVVFMTAIFPRVQWKYRFPRAYRILLLEAGHFCQTFCLTATWLGLAPFCTGALADTLIERSLGVDGVTESVIYAMGVGTRPGRTDWAPWPGGDPMPRTSAPAHRRRRTKNIEERTV